MPSLPTRHPEEHRPVGTAWDPQSKSAGGPYDEEMAERLRDRAFAVGNTVDPAEAYRSFRGRDAGVEALLRKRGFPVPEPPKD